MGACGLVGLLFTLEFAGSADIDRMKVHRTTISITRPSSGRSRTAYRCEEDHLWVNSVMWDHLEVVHLGRQVYLVPFREQAGFCNQLRSNAELDGIWRASLSDGPERATEWVTDCLNVGPPYTAEAVRPATTRLGFDGFEVLFRSPPELVFTGMMGTVCGPEPVYVPYEVVGLERSDADGQLVYVAEVPDRRGLALAGTLLLLPTLNAPCP